MALHGAVLALHGDAGEIAHVLVAAREGVEKGGLAAVLIAHQRQTYGRSGSSGLRLRGQKGTLFFVVASAFTQTGMGNLLSVGDVGLLVGILLRCGALQIGVDGDFGSIRLAHGQLVAVDAHLDGIAHRGVLDERDTHAGYDAHIQKMLPQGTVAADSDDAGGLC